MRARTLVLAIGARLCVRNCLKGGSWIRPESHSSYKA